MPLFLTSGRDYGSLRAPASSDSASLMAPVTDESELAPKVPVGQWTFTHTHTTLNASVGFFQWHIIQATFRPWKEFDWRFNLAISGLHFFKSRAVHQPRSIQDPFATERRVLSHPSLHSCPRRLRRTSAGRHRSFMTWSFSWASFTINIAIYSFIMNHPSMLTYIYYDAFLSFCSNFVQDPIGWLQFVVLCSNLWDQICEPIAMSGVPGWSRKANSLVLTRLTLRNKKRAILKRLHSNRCRFRYL